MREYNVGAVYINDNVYAGETNIPLLKGNQGYSISRVVKTSGTGTPGSYDTYTIYINTNPESIVGTFQVWNGTGNIGDMTKAEYDTDNDGIVDNAERVNNHTVDIDVPSNAKFTDTIYDDTAITNRVTTLENAGYITKSVSDLVNYYLKTDTYTKTEVNTLVDTIPKFAIEVVNSLPTHDISTTTIYLVRDDSQTGDIYQEYIYVNNTWEMLGAQRIDLSNYYNKTETNTLLNAKQDTLVSGTNIKTINNTSLVGSGNISIAGNEVAISDTEPTSADNEIWVDTSSNATYINQEVNIGATNPSNTRTWFKVSTNLLDESALVTGGINESTGQDISNATRKRTGYINAKASTKYTLSITAPAVLWLIFYYYNEDFTFISSRAQASQTSVTDTSPANTKYIRVVIGNTATEVASNIMLNEGETALPYEPYVRKAININGEDEYYTNDYSTEEQVIGIWLGKPLYRKVVNFTISSTWQDVGTFSNVDFFTKIQLVRKTGGNAYPYYQDSNNYCYAYIPATKTRIILASSSNENGNAGSLIVEYTKTTD